MEGINQLYGGVKIMDNKAVNIAKSGAKTGGDRG
jgi:hypothetical protein